MSQEFLESFLVSDADMTAELKRSSNPTYEMQNEKFMIRRQKKEPMLQYANLYFLRLQKLKPAIINQATEKWIKPLTNSQPHSSEVPEIVENILDMKADRVTIIIGTFFKEQAKKPTVLENIMGVIQTGENVPGVFTTTEADLKTASQVSDKEKVPERDSGVLEDRSGRIVINDGNGFNIDDFASGTILAFKGRVIDGGYFQVEDFCMAGVPYHSIVPPDSLIGRQRDLYEPMLMKSSEQRRFVAFASGLSFGLSDSVRNAEFILSFLRGELFGVINTPNGKLD